MSKSLHVLLVFFLVDLLAQLQSTPQEKKAQQEIAAKTWKQGPQGLKYKDTAPGNIMQGEPVRAESYCKASRTQKNSFRERGPRTGRRID